LFGRQDLELEELKAEADIFETAKNSRAFSDGRKTAHFERDQVAKLIANEYPFSLSSECIQTLQHTIKEIDEIKAKIEVLSKIKAPVSDFLEHLETLKKMPFRCDIEYELKKMSSDYEFVT
jgi:hypothetical protein